MAALRAGLPVKNLNKKICIARHNKYTRPGIATLWSVLEENWTVKVCLLGPALREHQKKGNDNQERKKTQKCTISYVRGEAPVVDIVTYS